MQGLQVKVSWYLSVSTKGNSADDDLAVGTVGEAREEVVEWKRRWEDGWMS